MKRAIGEAINRLVAAPQVAPPVERDRRPADARGSRHTLTFDTPVRLISDLRRRGHVQLIDWSAQRANVRWADGLLGGVALADIEPVPGPADRHRIAPVAVSSVVPGVLHPAE